MSSQQENQTDIDPKLVRSNPLSEQLNCLLETSRAEAIAEFNNGERSSGFTAIWHYVAAFLHTGIVNTEFLKGRRGFVACSVAAQHAYNRKALIYSMAVEKK